MISGHEKEEGLNFLAFPNKLELQKSFFLASTPWPTLFLVLDMECGVAPIFPGDP